MKSNDILLHKITSTPRYNKHFIMNTKSSLVEDTLPRSFPKGKKQFMKNTALVPKPTLPGVSIIADKNKLPKPAPKKSFTKWKQQHEAIFKQVRTIPFQSNSAPTCKFELGFHGPSNNQRNNEQQHQHYEYDSAKFKRTMQGDVNKPDFQNMITFSQLNRIARFEAVKGKGKEDREDQQPSNQYEECQPKPCGCHSISPSQHLTYPSQKNGFEDKQDLQLDQFSDRQLIKLSKENDKKSKLTDNALVNIVEEQIEIVKQQKHILMQQNEIFSLQYQIEKLLLMGNSQTKSLKQITPATSTGVKPKALPIQNGSPQIMPNNPNTSPTSRKSIGLMTSFNGNLNDITSPNENRNKRLASEKDSHKDTMLERINKIIKNSPPMINYRVNNENMNCRISPNRADLNISSQTLIYKTSNRNNVSMNELKIADRSFALHCLDMKYRPQISSSPNAQRLNFSPRNNNTAGKTKRVPIKDTDNDYVPLNISPDKYDYLIRHGLM